MVHRAILKCLVLLSATIECICDTRGLDDAGDLVLVNVLHRHGDRTPVSSYPTDPYLNNSFWPDGWGQLTNKGKLQTYMLGKWLRQKYDEFLPKNYSKDYIYIQSTDVDRTLMSAESNLAGLFPPQGRQEWNPQLLWQPIPIHTIPEKDDMVLAAQRPCPKYDKEYKSLMISKQMREFNEKHSKLYEYLSKHSGTLVHDIITFEYLYDTLHVEDMFNLTLPDWTKGIYPDEMSYIVDYSFTVQAFTESMQRLKSGPLLKVMISSMQEVVDNTPDSKMMYVYSAHDTTVSNLMMTLGVFNLQAPPYVATLILELRKRNNEYNVIVLYRNSTDEPYILTIPKCESVCPYNKFIKLTKSRVPGNWVEECKIGAFYDFQLNTLTIIALSCSGFLAMLLVISILFSVLYWKKKYSTSYYYHHVHTEEQ